MDPHSRSAKKNTNHWNEVLPQNIRHLIQRPCNQRGSPCQHPAGNRTTRRPPDLVKRRNCSGMDMSPVHRVWPKPSCKAQWKGEEDKADSERSGKTWGNGQARSSPSPRRQWRTGENGGNWLWNHLWCPSDPRGLVIDDNDDVKLFLVNWNFLTAFLGYFGLFVIEIGLIQDGIPSMEFINPVFTRTKGGVTV